MSALSLRGVQARIDGRVVLNDVDFDATPGEVVALCGPNGAGKSSLLRAALGLLPITAGSVTVGGAALDSLKGSALSDRVAYLPQDRRIAWNMPAVEIAALGAPCAASADARRRAGDALQAVGMGDLAHRGVAEMSGGERARVLLARLLATEAPLLLADEPAAGLDPDAQLLALALLRARAGEGAAVVITLHDLALAARAADRIVVIDAGAIVANGAPRDVLSPALLASVFGVAGAWAETPLGPALATARL